MAPRSLPALLLVGLLAGGLTLGERPTATDTSTGPTAHGYEQTVRPVLVRRGCSPVAFDQVEGERAALVRTPAGLLRVVSLAHGRAVYDGRRPGVLVGVCTQRP